MFHSEHLQEKWAPLLNYEGLDQIKDSHRRSVTAVLLENQERFLREESAFQVGNLSNLMEAPTNAVGNGGFTGSAAAAGPTAGFDPVLISLIRRSMPNLIAYDIAGVQPMSGPTGLIFAMRSRYANQSGAETFYDEVNSAFSGQNSAFDNVGFGSTAAGIGTTSQYGSNPSVLNPVGGAGDQTAYNTGTGMLTGDAEALGDGAGGDHFNQMAFSIEKVTVTAKSRALKAEYSLELAQDLKAIHGLNAEAELANILSTEILAEINREVIRTIYKVAEQGAVQNVATPGIFDLDIDSNGRWSVEKFKGLLFQIERDANAIAQRTRRGKGNIIVCSADVASALTMAGVLDYTPALNANLTVDDTGNTFAGVLQGKYRQATSIMLLVIRVLHLMTPDSSIVLMFLSKWFVPLARTASSQKSDLRPVMEWLQTHSLKVLIKVLEDFKLTLTATIVELQLRTLCDPFSQSFSESRKGLFFYLNT
jgi:hypothetical protein